MIKLNEIIKEIENFAPLVFQEDYDNSGLQIGNLNQNIKNILLSLDCTNEVLDYAIKNKIDLIINHHPLFFNKINQINFENENGKIVEKAIKNNISIYACHTNLDNVFDGVNYKIASKLNLQNISFLRNKLDSSKKFKIESNKNLLLYKKKKDKKEEEEVFDKQSNFKKLVGSGLIGDLKKSITVDSFFKEIKEIFKIPIIKHSKLFTKNVRRVAICGGSGSFLINDAIINNADIFLTSDLKYHDFYQNKIIIADIGHFESEQFTCELFNEILNNILKSRKLNFFSINTNLINYK